MLDIKRIVQNKDAVEKALLKRMDKKSLNLDEIISTYNLRKQAQCDFDSKRAEQNEYNAKMSSVDKNSDEFKNLLLELKKKSTEVKEAEETLKNLDEKLIHELEVLPNIPDEDVSAGGKEANKVIKITGEKPIFNFKIKDHVELGKNLGLFDLDTASKISGNNFNMYTDLGARLEWAIINYFISEHIKSGYTMIIPPNLVTRDSAYCAGQLPKFEEDVYWVQDGLCLIPTAETALTNIFRNEILNESELPKKFFAYTPCYRREAGSYRANEKGLIRMHQFNKVEMYQFTTEDGSEKAFDELVEKAESLVNGLKLHYRVVKLAAGDCSAAAAKTYDIEVYIPSLDMYYEVSSVSNVRDYQSRRGNMRYKKEKDGEIKYMHTLNGSGLATSRLMVSLLETYQQEDGSIAIPEILRPFMDNMDIISK